MAWYEADLPNNALQPTFARMPFWKGGWNHNHRAFVKPIFGQRRLSAVVSSLLQRGRRHILSLNTCDQQSKATRFSDTQIVLSTQQTVNGVSCQANLTRCRHNRPHIHAWRRADVQNISPRNGREVSHIRKKDERTYRADGQAELWNLSQDNVLEIRCTYGISHRAMCLRSSRRTESLIEQCAWGQADVRNLFQGNVLDMRHTWGIYQRAICLRSDRRAKFLTGQCAWGQADSMDRSRRLSRVGHIHRALADKEYWCIRHHINHLAAHAIMKKLLYAHIFSKWRKSLQFGESQKGGLFYFWPIFTKTIFKIPWNKAIQLSYFLV